MAQSGKDRIGTAKMRFVAPRGAVHLQAQADRAARQAKHRLTRKLDACLPNNTEFLVIDGLDCAPVAVAGTDPVDAVASAIATAITSHRSGTGVWRFETEAAYVAAFLAAFDRHRPPTGAQWTGLRHAGEDGPVAALLLLCAERGLTPPQVLSCPPMQGSVLKMLSDASPEFLKALVRLSTAGQPTVASGAEALVAAALEILASAKLSSPDQAAIRQAILAAPVIWSDPASLADAVARGVFTGGWPRGGTATTASTGGEGRALPPLPQAIVAAIDRFAWLDQSRLKQAMTEAILPSASPSLRRAIALLGHALAELSIETGSLPQDTRIKREALRLLWLTALARRSPDHAVNPLFLELIGRVTSDTRGPSPPGLGGLRHLWNTLSARLASNAMPDRPVSMPESRTDDAGDTNPSPATSPSRHIPAAESRDRVEHRAASPFAQHIESGSAGLFLLWRTLVDLNFRAEALAVCNQPNFPNRVLWTLCRDEIGAEGDDGARHFAGLLDATDPPVPITEDEADHLAAKLARAPAVRLSGRTGLGLADTLITAFTFWLRGYETSSTDFVRKTFLHRGGTLFLGASHMEIQVDPCPFDLVLRRAGYLEPFSAPDWLGGTRTHFSIAEAS